MAEEDVSEADLSGRLATVLEEIRDVMEKRKQRIEELQQMGAFRHPHPNRKVINVDFTEAMIDAEETTEEHMKPILEYKLVYDEVYGVYRKVRR